MKLLILQFGIFKSKERGVSFCWAVELFSYPIWKIDENTESLWKNNQPIHLFQNKWSLVW